MKALRTLFLILIVLIVPLFGAWHLALSWPVVLAALTGFLLNTTQPDVTAKDLQEKNTVDRRSILFIQLSGMGVFLLPILELRFSRGLVPPISNPISLIGIFATIAGLSFRYWSIRTLGRFFTSKVHIQEDHTVIQNGPYRYLRHPSYSGAFVLMVGISLIFHSRWGLVACFLSVLPSYFYRISVEERTLVDNLGEVYREYMTRTWRLLPFVY